MVDRGLTTYIAQRDREFVEQGGIRERMTAARMGYRNDSKAEIERLRAELAEARAEIARLRAELTGKAGKSGETGITGGTGNTGKTNSL